MFTVDLLVATLLLTVVIGSTAMLFELTTQAARAEIDQHNNALLAAQQSGSTPQYCTTYVDASGTLINTSCASATSIWDCRDWLRRTRIQYTHFLTPTPLAFTAEGCPGVVTVR